MKEMIMKMFGKVLVGVCIVGFTVGNYVAMVRGCSALETKHDALISGLDAECARLDAELDTADDTIVELVANMNLVKTEVNKNHRNVKTLQDCFKAQREINDVNDKYFTLLVNDLRSRQSSM